MKFFANLASTSEHAAALRGLLDGSVALDDLEIDTDLSWELLEGLVLVGDAGEAEIAAALEKDNTANGQQAAARARATIATFAGKRAALEAAISDASMSNVLLRSSGVGYQHVNDTSDLAGLMEPYFDALVDVWTNRSYQIASYVIQGFFPPIVSQELVDTTNRWLEAHPEVPALRRLVIEQLAGVERALRAQERDAQA